MFKKKEGEEGQVGRERVTFLLRQHFPAAAPATRIQRPSHLSQRRVNKNKSISREATHQISGRRRADVARAGESRNTQKKRAPVAGTR